MPSSSDLIADRRFALAQGYAEDGDHSAAADLFAQAVERVPGWAPGWAALGDSCERSGNPAGARDAWARAAALDPEGGLAAAAHVARLDGRAPDALPEPYLRALFDEYAPRFDRHLVEELDYRGPAMLVAALERAAPGRRFARAFDLGCGTGLMGLALRGPRAVAKRARADEPTPTFTVDRLDGVDLSPAMAERARTTGAYAQVTAGSLEGALGAMATGALDLAIAADVLVYLGDLAPAFAGAARALRPGGLLAFTLQALAEGDGFALGPDMRFSHAASHVEGALRVPGFTPVLVERASARREGGTAVPGLVIVAERSPEPGRR